MNYLLSALIAMGMIFSTASTAHAGENCYGEAIQEFHDCTTNYPGWNVPGDSCQEAYAAEMDDCDATRAELLTISALYR